MFPAGCASEIRGQTKAGVYLRAQLEVPTDLSGSSSVGASPPSLQETGSYMAQVRGAGTWYGGQNPVLQVQRPGHWSLCLCWLAV